MRKVTDQLIDTEPDLFNFNFLGFSGKFYFDKYGAFQCIPANTLKLIQCPVNNTLVAQPENWQEWIIADDKGNRYHFGSSSASGVETTTLREMPLGTIDELNTSITGWYLTKIVMANKEEVNFQYNYKSEIYRQPDNYSYKILTNTPHGTPASGTTWSDQLDCNTILKNGKRVGGDSYETYTNTYISGNTTLSKIIWNGGEIVFESTTQRQDINSGVLLDGILVKNTEGKNLKRFRFTYQYIKQRYFLTEFKELDGNSTLGTAKTWLLNYITPNNLPLRGSFAQDHWGFYNGEGFNTHLIPPQPEINQPSLSANRNSSEYNMKMGALNSITYPTGGRSVFEWEANKLDLNSPVGGVPAGTPQICGGLRIKEIVNYNNTTFINKRRFEYNDGQMLVFPKYVHQYGIDASLFEDVPPEGPPLIDCIINNANFREATSSSQTILGFTQGSVVGYTNVKEFFVDQSNISNGYSQYMYTFTQDVGNELQYNGSYWPGMNILNTSIPLNSNEFKRGLLYKKIDYKLQGGSYLKVKEEESIYNFSNPDRLNSLKGMRVRKMLQLNYKCGTVHEGYMYPTGFDLSPDFSYSFYILTTGWVQNTTTIERFFDKDGLNPLVNTINYTYSNSVYLQPSASEKNSSTAKINRKEFKYSYDFPSNPVFSGMVSRNIIAQPVEVISKVIDGTQTTLLSTERTDFKLFNDIYKPELIKRSQYSNPLDNIVRFNQYDTRGNVTDVQKENDVRMGYLWSANGLYPVAEITNAPIKDVFYTSFEDGDGNSVSYDAKAGVKSKIGGFVKSLTGLSAGSYKLSYWQKSGNIWSLIQSTISVTGTTYTINLSGQVDDIRFHPAAGQMTTYTYETLVGLTSSSDVNNRITYYEYDSFQRLVFVKDHDKNIIKRLCYNYAGQSVSCDLFSNDDKSGLFTRNNCGVGFTGGSVNVSIPAGMFTSTISKADANNQATLYGQTQANTTGTCTSSSVTVQCNNTVSGGTFYMQYYNQSTGQMYNFNVSSTGYNINLGSIPAGTYTITIGSSIYNTNFYYSVACGFFNYGNNATFYNVNVDNTCKLISISPY